jgi:hypothetical protein
VFCRAVRPLKQIIIWNSEYVNFWFTNKLDLKTVMSDCYWEANIHCLFNCTVLIHYYMCNLFTLANLISTSDDTLTAMLIGVEQHTDSKYLHVQTVPFSDTFTYVMKQDVNVKLNPGLPRYKAAFNKTNTSKVLHLEHSCVRCWNLETCTSQLPFKCWNLLLGEDGKYQLDRSCEDAVLQIV